MSFWKSLLLSVEYSHTNIFPSKMQPFIKSIVAMLLHSPVNFVPLLKISVSKSTQGNTFCKLVHRGSTYQVTLFAIKYCLLICNCGNTSYTDHGTKGGGETYNQGFRSKSNQKS